VSRPEILDRVFAFACACVEMYRHLVKRGGAGRALAGQFLHAGTSVGANLEEAQGSPSKVDFIARTTIALKEAREAHYWLRLFERCRLGDLALISPLCREAGEIVAILTTSVKNAKSNVDR